jgi:hypothetical protein
MQNKNIDILDELAYSMDYDDDRKSGVDEPMLSLSPRDSQDVPDKQDKLEKLRQKMDERMKQKRVQEDAPLGRDMYLQKVTNFLITSFFLNLAIEHIFTYSLMHDYINGYLDNETYYWNGRIEGNNYCFLLFYFFRIIGFRITDRFLIDSMQKDVNRRLNKEEVARKTIITAILGSSASMFISTRILQAKSFFWFTFFYSALPALLTGSPFIYEAPVSLFLTINLSRIGKRRQINLKLLYSLQYMAYFASIIILSLLSNLLINMDNIRPLQINTFPENQTSFFIRVGYTPSYRFSMLLSVRISARFPTDLSSSHFSVWFSVSLESSRSTE